MPAITDLPQELLELIFFHLIITPTLSHHPGYPQHPAACTVGHLRSTQSLAFTDFLGRRSKTLPRAKCQYLIVDMIWIYDERPDPESPRSDSPQWGSPKSESSRSVSSPTNLISSEILEKLLQLFSDTIITLDLIFVNLFRLLNQTIKAIGKIKHLDESVASEEGTHSEDSDASGEGTHSEDSDISIEAHPSWFNLLMMGAQGLKSLQLELPFSRRSSPDLMTEAQYPEITYLEVDTTRFTKR
ncbi:hypothetical protein PCANC_22638 [Puccinia coronata f. sp. avenae]|uniref:F-box domain-containing protein n=1 Tax=Puccinia coronata f. sp. avenae TaxID=200324 RepID=A0A2N5TLC5_9BASI|nr:hypothetical protein PCANC_22638 [Puccinia coronata f. sp. avenae]